ncbi:MAG: hypothetical protein ACOYD4_05795 [Solirubrobacterales bacterium]
MTDVDQPRTARRTLLPAGILATALFALLAWAPFASAAPNPVASGSTTMTLNSGFTKYLKTFGITTSKISPTKLKGAKATFTITGGTLDPLTGLGSVTLGGGLKFKAGKKGAPVKALVLDTNKKTLSGKIGGKKVKVATVAGITTARNGFGSSVTIKKVKLTGSAASALNKKLGYAKGKPKPFLGNKLIASAAAETQPSTLGVQAAGNASLALSIVAQQKLAKVGPPACPCAPGVEQPFKVNLAPVAPTSIVSVGPPTTVAFPIGGGTIGPSGAAGVVQTVGGLTLTQNLDYPGVEKGVTTLTMGNIWVDLGAKTASVEVIITNPKTPEANLGNLGRASIADINLTGATITSDPATHTVSVQNASATLQAVTAETLNQVFIKGLEKTFGPDDVQFAAGDPLGTFSFTATTE